MALFYSPAGFFDDAIHPAIPADAVQITAARHRALLAGQADGRRIVTGDDGRPRLARASAEPIEQRRARLHDRVRREAARRIDAVSPLWRQLNDLRAGDDADARRRFAAIDVIRAASDAIGAQIDDATATALDAIDIAAHPAWPNEGTL